MFKNVQVTITNYVTDWPNQSSNEQALLIPIITSAPNAMPKVVRFAFPISTCGEHDKDNSFNVLNKISMPLSI